jgi:hypothetical protein
MPEEQHVIAGRRPAMERVKDGDEAGRDICNSPASGLRRADLEGIRGYPAVGRQYLWEKKIIFLQTGPK